MGQISSHLAKKKLRVTTLSLTRSLEHHLFALVGDQWKIRQMLLLDALARSLLRDRSKLARFTSDCRGAQHSRRQRCGCRQAKELSSGNIRHDRTSSAPHSVVWGAGFLPC